FGWVVQLTLSCRLAQFVIGNAAPEEERKPGREIEAGNAIYGSGRRTGRIALHAEEETGTSQQRAQADFNTILKRAVRAHLPVEAEQSSGFGILHRPAVSASRQFREDPPRTWLFVLRVFGPADENLAAAGCVATTLRIEWACDGDRVESRLNARVPVH